MSEIPTKEKLDKYEPWLDRFDGEEARLLKGLFIAARELHRIRHCNDFPFPVPMVSVYVAAMDRVKELSQARGGG